VLSECGALFGVRLVLDGLLVGLKHSGGEVQDSLKVSVGVLREVVLRVGHSVEGCWLNCRPQRYDDDSHISKSFF